MLATTIRSILPAHPEEGLLPLRVFRPGRDTIDWLEDRAGPFFNYSRHPSAARKRMARIFNVACSALAAVNSMNDDTATHFVSAVIPSLTAFPVRLHFQLPNMTSECGWTNQRPALVWFVNTSTVVKKLVLQATYSFDDRTLLVHLATTIGNHRSASRVLERRARTVDGQLRIDISVKLGRVPTGSDPVYELLSRNLLFKNLRLDSRCRGNQIVDSVYSSGARPPAQAPLSFPEGDAITTSVGGREITLRPDQTQAVRAGDRNCPLLAIQAAFGTGKTVVGALIAARIADTAQGVVIATATTNTAVAQFADTLLKLDHYGHLPVLRNVSDSAIIEGAPRTPVDLNVLLKRLETDYANSLSQMELHACRSYKNGRELLETVMFNPETTLQLSENERNEYSLAEEQISEQTKEMVELLFEQRPPAIMCLTTAALLNSTEKGTIFHDLLNNVILLIGDEASQIPEPTLLALASCFNQARHIYIGDVHELEPHVRCARSSNPAKFGGKGVMELLVSKDIPLAPLRTTFRAHPQLNDLPNTLFYDGSLISGTPAEARQLLLEKIPMPNSTALSCSSTYPAPQ